jgi:hypothetical protein
VKHGIDRFTQLGKVRFVDATGIDPEVSEAITSRLFRAEPNLLVAILLVSSSLFKVPKGYLFGIWAPRVRQYGILGNIANQILCKAKLAVATC